MRINKPLRLALLSLAALLLLAGGYLAWAVLSLPDVAPLADPAATLTITVRDWKGEERPFLVGPENPDWTPLRWMPPALVDALVAAEDINFPTHRGVDWKATWEAAKRDWKAGRITHGGSTITQQLAKNLFLSREKTFTRKIRELVLAGRMEKALSKDRILELYLNAVEFGPRVNGAPRAARHYFGRPLSSLSLGECAFLVAMLPSPRVYDPYRKPERVERATLRVLDLMRLTGRISQEQHDAGFRQVALMELLPRATATAPSTPFPPEEAEAEAEDFAWSVEPEDAPELRLPPPEAPPAPEEAPALAGSKAPAVAATP